MEKSNSLVESSSTEEAIQGQLELSSFRSSAKSKESQEKKNNNNNQWHQAILEIDQHDRQRLSSGINNSHADHCVRHQCGSTAWRIESSFCLARDTTCSTSQSVWIERANNRTLDKWPSFLSVQIEVRDASNRVHRCRWSGSHRDENPNGWDNYSSNLRTQTEDESMRIRWHSHIASRVTQKETI